MAKNKRTKTSTHSDRGETVLNVATNLLIATKGVIEGLVEKKSATQERVRKINETFNKPFLEAQEKQHVNKRAANIAFNLNSLEDEELHETLYHLFFYIKDLGLLDRAKKQEELFSAGETGPGLKGGEPQHRADEENDDDKHSTSTRIGAAARRVAEAAGAHLPGD